MNTRSVLEHALTEILHVINPLREDLETRMQIIDELRDAVSTIDSLRGTTCFFTCFLSQAITRCKELIIVFLYFS